MTTAEIAIQNGYVYSGECRICSIPHGVYKNPDKPDFEIKIRKRDGYVRMFQRGRQVSFAGLDNMQERMKTHGLI